MDKVNHFNVKRKAHGISRRDSEQSWNPFRHFTWDSRTPPDGRRGTWNGPDVEAGRVAPIDEADPEKKANNLGHVQSEPAFGKTMQRDFSTAETMGNTMGGGSSGLGKEKSLFGDDLCAGNAASCHEDDEGDVVIAGGNHGCDDGAFAVTDEADAVGVAFRT